MSNTSNYNISTNGIQLTTGTITVPNPPRDLVAVTAVQTSAGWLGQNLVNGDIVWESTPFQEKEAALKAANARVISRIRKLFT